MGTIEEDAKAYAAATHVQAHLFNERGKWKYEVFLDYSGSWSLASDVNGYIDPVDAAELALETATNAGTSGVMMRKLESGWMLVVFEPPNGWPIMVKAPPAVEDAKTNDEFRDLYWALARDIKARLPEKFL